MTALDDLLYPEAREPQRQVRPVERGTVISVDGSTIRFRLDAFPHRTGFPPAPYGLWTDEDAGDPAHHHILDGPQVGDQCLIAFAGAGTGDPWCVSWRR